MCTKNFPASIKLYAIIKIPKKDEAAEVSLHKWKERSVGHEARKERQKTGVGHRAAPLPVLELLAAGLSHRHKAHMAAGTGTPHLSVWHLCG